MQITTQNRIFSNDKSTRLLVYTNNANSKRLKSEKSPYTALFTAIMFQVILRIIPSAMKIKQRKRRSERGKKKKKERERQRERKARQTGDSRTLEEEAKMGEIRVRVFVRRKVRV